MKKSACRCEGCISPKQSPASNRRLLRHGFAIPRNDVWVFRFALVILVIPLLSACAMIGNAGPTPVVAGLTEARPEVPMEAATPTIEPFRFDLPMPGAEPVSGWRPPLYPVPWALSPYDHFYFTRPIAADQVNWPLADYRYGGVFFGPNVVHTGVDIPAPEGTPILAAGPGVVVWTGWGLFSQSQGNTDDPYGIAVAIRQDFGYKGQQLYSVYAHMSKTIAVVGQRVETGDLIGLVGSTGETTGPHIHFEVRFPNNSFYNTYNPELWMAPPLGQGVLAGRVTDRYDKTLQLLEVYVTSEATGKTRLAKSYGGGATNPDPYYNENLVLGDLPAGLYKITLTYDNRRWQEWVTIYAGQVTYFTFRGSLGFNLAPPPTPTVEVPPATTP